jgi:hypothetical protein
MSACVKELCFIITCVETSRAMKLGLCVNSIVEAIVMREA